MFLYEINIRSIVFYFMFIINVRNLKNIVLTKQNKYNIYPIDQYNPTRSCDLIDSHKKTKFNILLK